MKFILKSLLRDAFCKCHLIVCEKQKNSVNLLYQKIYTAFSLFLQLSPSPFCQPCLPSGVCWLSFCYFLLIICLFHPNAIFPQLVGRVHKIQGMWFLSFFSQVYLLSHLLSLRNNISPKKAQSFFCLSLFYKYHTCNLILKAIFIIYY